MSQLPTYTDSLQRDGSVKRLHYDEKGIPERIQYLPSGGAAAAAQTSAKNSEGGQSQQGTHVMNTSSGTRAQQQTIMSDDEVEMIDADNNMADAAAVAAFDSSSLSWLCDSSNQAASVSLSSSSSSSSSITIKELMAKKISTLQQAPATHIPHPLEVLKHECEKTSGIVLIYNNTSDVDSFGITIDKCNADRLTADVWPLLIQNSCFHSWLDYRQGKPCVFAESTLLAFQMFLNLHQQQVNDQINRFVDISLVSSSILLAALKNPSAASSPPVPQPEKWQEVKFKDEDPRVRMRFRHCDSIRELCEGAPLHVFFVDSLLWFSELGSLKQIHKSLSTLLGTLRNGGQDAPKVFPNMEWEELVEDKPKVYEQLNNENKVMLRTTWKNFTADVAEQIHSSYKVLAKEEEAAVAAKELEKIAAAAKVAEANKLKKQEDRNKKEIALQAVGQELNSESESEAESEVESYVPMEQQLIFQALSIYNRVPQSLRNAINTFNSELIETIKPMLSESNKGQFKGAFSDCGKHSASVTIEADDSSELMNAYLFKWVGEGQTTFGLQPYVEGFKDQEYRFWFTSGATSLTDPTKRWRLAVTLESRYVIDSNGARVLQVEQSCTLTPQANACYDLALKLVTEHKFFADLLTLKHPIPAIRLDCGYNPTTNTAFLNELAVSPGGWLFSQLHRLDILSYVTDELSNQMAECLQPPSSQ